MSFHNKKRQNAKKIALRIICVILAVLLVGSSLAAIFGIF